MGAASLARAPAAAQRTHQNGAKVRTASNPYVTRVVRKIALRCGLRCLCTELGHSGLRFARSQARKNKQAAKEQAEREGKPLPAAPPKKKKQKKLASKDASPEHSTVYDYESPSNPQSDQQQHHQEHMHHSMHGNDHHQGVPLHHGSMSTTLPPIHSLIMPPTSTGHHFYPFHNFGSDPLDHRLGVNNQHW